LIVQDGDEPGPFLVEDLGGHRGGEPVPSRHVGDQTGDLCPSVDRCLLKWHVGQFGEVELCPVVLGALECGRSDAGIDENGDSEILGHKPVRISARPPVQIAEPIVGAVCGEQVLDGREPTVYASGTND